jgi:hypothetical protein
MKQTACIAGMHERRAEARCLKHPHAGSLGVLEHALPQQRRIELRELRTVLTSERSIPLDQSELRGVSPLEQGQHDEQVLQPTAYEKMFVLPGRVGWQLRTFPLVRLRS